MFPLHTVLPSRVCYYAGMAFGMAPKKMAPLPVKIVALGPTSPPVAWAGGQYSEPPWTV